MNNEKFGAIPARKLDAADTAFNEYMKAVRATKGIDTPLEGDISLIEDDDVNVESANKMVFNLNAIANGEKDANGNVLVYENDLDSLVREKIMALEEAQRERPNSLNIQKALGELRPLRTKLLSETV